MKQILAIGIACLLLTGCAGNSHTALFGSTGWFAFPQQREATGKKTFVFNPRKRAWAVYDESGSRVRTGKASGGVKACPEDGEDCTTVRGVFQVQRKGDETCVSKSYPIGEGGAPMPYCMFFHQGYAIHGSNDVPNFHASHGCIRVTTAAARWLNEEFMGVGSQVEVTSY